LLEGLFGVDITWRPYVGFPSYSHIHEELAKLQLVRWIQGCHSGEYEMIPVDKVQRQF
ncbi:hypothetical protein KI387_027273, partial [Taxus chinensis]